MTVAIFDLDHTLLDTDSDHAWGEFLVQKKVVDSATFQKANDYFYKQYHQGELNLEEYLAFCLRPLADNEPEFLYKLRSEFVETIARPLIKPGVSALLEKHCNQGHALLVITATNQFVVDPIIDAIGIQDRLAIEVEMVDGRYTGKHIGIPSFKEGKITRFKEWLKENPGHNIDECWFYSDSMNDLPLLEHVGHPVAVDPDEKLKAIAEERNWPVISLK
ncbi:histidinol-phosphatase [Sansalvadorimonas verongulae]|uniref:histidinol-phosphatase n=1 Tax=Sansalvadorimonas verongulae TaxID=2172824 RepID=UPI002E376F5E|nr:HAD family hydrolase [Sansalvadorimonas verongulae]MTI15049.1 HAD family hydrolase [Sansalvadorimonas verongulae]